VVNTGVLGDAVPPRAVGADAHGVVSERARHRTRARIHLTCTSIRKLHVNIADNSMPLQKQEFYEGAALHALARTGLINTVRVTPPFFLINGSIAILLKYSTRGRSPWGFTFTPDEQQALLNNSIRIRTILGLICGSDGISAIDYEAFASIAQPRNLSLRVSCFRDHGEHYEIRGPDGVLTRKIAPSAWQRLLETESRQ
jgi:hypothetical protein